MNKEERGPLEQVASYLSCEPELYRDFLFALFQDNAGLQATQSVDGSWTPSIGDCD